jgi:hypothetical protein
MAFGDFTVTRASTKNVLGASGSFVSVANNVPAFEFNTDGSYRGLLVEPGATNSIRNNTMVGAVAGSPGTMPTNWTTVDAGLTREVLGTGTENGVNYIDIKYSGTASGTTLEIRTDANAAIVASNGQVWTQSYFIKTLASPTPPVGYLHIMNERTGAGAFVTSGSSSFTPTTSLARYRFTRTLAGGGTVERVQATLAISLVNGNSYDFSFRIGWPQMERESLATSPIITTGSTANRSADSVTLASASSLIGQSSGTLYVEYEVHGVNSTTARIFNVTDGSLLNRITLVTTPTAMNTRLIVTTGNVEQALISQVATASGIYKAGIAYAPDDIAFYLNGASIGTDTSATIPACNRVNIGTVETGTGGSTNFAGHIRSVSLFPTRLANATLVTLTTL